MADLLPNGLQEKVMIFSIMLYLLKADLLKNLLGNVEQIKKRKV